MSAITTGRIGEYIAAAVCELHGWKTVICPIAGFDMIVTRGSKIYRCQVKASSFHEPDGSRYKDGKLQWHFGIGGDKHFPTMNDYDFVACVSIPHRRCHFLPIEKIKTITMSRSGTIFHDMNLESTTFNETMEILNERTAQLDKRT